MKHSLHGKRLLIALALLLCAALLAGCSGGGKAPYDDYALSLSQEAVRAALGEPGESADANMSYEAVDIYDDIDFLGMKGRLFFGYSDDLSSLRYIYWACKDSRDITELNGALNRFLKYFNKRYGEAVKVSQKDGTLDPEHLPSPIPKDRCQSAWEWREADGRRVLFAMLVVNGGTTVTVSCLP